MRQRTVKRRPTLTVNLLGCPARCVAVIDGKPGAHGLWLPDLPRCTSMGRTEELLANTQEAMRLWARMQLDSGEPIAEPTGVEAIRQDPDVVHDLAAGAALVIVPLVAHDVQYHRHDRSGIGNRSAEINPLMFHMKPR